jgi:hypothetical protein
VKRFISLLVVSTLIVSGLVGPFVDSSSAVTAADWKPGRIIDDGIFTDPSGMSVGDIQNFLNSKVPACDTNGSKISEFGGGTRAQWAIARGYPGTFTCLRDYYEVPKTEPGNYIPANNYGGKPIPAGAISAAQMIYNASQRYQINPKVLLVTIHKESSGPLTTDEWPLEKQYTYAMGAHCPDSGPGGSANCDVNYSGFSMQIAESAALMRWYLDSMSQSWWQYKKPYQNNYVLWNVSQTGCGGGNVYIENKATAALYTYTPYQPNQAALNNMYGTGDGCSAYGNRNFWRIFSDWFGTTYNPDYSWQLVRQYVYTDSTKTAPAGLSGLLPGDRRYVGFVFKNTGNVTWTNNGPNPIKLGTSGPLERSSAFKDTSWPSATRAATLKETSVAPGEIGTFEFWITAPQVSQDSAFNEYFTPLAEGRAWFPNIGLFYGITVQQPRYSWQMISQYAYTDQTKSQPININSVMPGQKIYAGFTAKNTGNMPWANSGVNSIGLGTTGPPERKSVFSASSDWISGTRPTTSKETTIAPGQTGTFEFWMTAPSLLGQGGVYNERFNLLINNVTWMNDVGMSYYMNVVPPSYTWQMINQYAYTDQTKTTPVNMNTLKQGQRIYLGITAKNTGSLTWQNSGANAIMLGTAGPLERQSKFSTGSNWLSLTRPALLKETTVAPLQTGTFDFWMTIPQNGTLGIYNERFNLIASNVTWMNDIGLSYYMNVSQ